MRKFAVLAFLAALALAPAASAQRDATVRAQTLPQAQLTTEPLLNGTWSMVQGASGQLTVTTRPDGVLEGTYVIAPCHGSYSGNAFILFCYRREIGTFVFTGTARETPPVNTRRSRRAGLIYRPAEITGQYYDPTVGTTAGLGNAHTFRATRN